MNQIIQKKSENNAASISQKIASLNIFYKDLGIATYLCAKSNYHQNFSSAYILAYIAPCLKLKFYKIYFKEMNPVAFVCWGFLSDEISDIFQKGNYVLRMDDFKSGENIWITEFIIANEDEKIREEVILDLKTTTFKNSEIRAIVRNDDGSVKRILTFQGSEYKNKKI